MRYFVELRRRMNCTRMKFAWRKNWEYNWNRMVMMTTSMCMEWTTTIKWIRTAHKHRRPTHSEHSQFREENGCQNREREQRQATVAQTYMEIETHTRAYSTHSTNTQLSIRQRRKKSHHRIWGTEASTGKEKWNE